jgi:hypothetical protein
MSPSLSMGRGSEISADLVATKADPGHAPATQSKYQKGHGIDHNSAGIPMTNHHIFLTIRVFASRISYYIALVGSALFIIRRGNWLEFTESA